MVHIQEFLTMQRGRKRYNSMVKPKTMEECDVIVEISSGYDQEDKVIP